MDRNHLGSWTKWRSSSSHGFISSNEESRSKTKRSDMEYTYFCICTKRRHKSSYGDGCSDEREWCATRYSDMDCSPLRIFTKWKHKSSHATVYSYEKGRIKAGRSCM